MLMNYASLFEQSLSQNLELNMLWSLSFLISWNYHKSPRSREQWLHYAIVLGLMLKRAEGWKCGVCDGGVSAHCEVLILDRLRLPAVFDHDCCICGRVLTTVPVKKLITLMLGSCVWDNLIFVILCCNPAAPNALTSRQIALNTIILESSAQSGQETLWLRQNKWHKPLTASSKWNT